MRILVIASFILSTLFFNFSFANQSKIGQQINSISDINGVEEYDHLLQKYVSSEGFVDYKGLKTEESTLDEVLAYFSTHEPSASASKEEKLAFWINVYNANTIKLILKNYPVSSIMKISSGKAWDVQWIKIGTRTLSLNNIENDIIRPQFNDPRIHFAVNCAAKSCPPILNHAFKANSLNSQLDTQARKFINSTSNQISANSLKISKIFEWYADDFGNLANFISKYSNVKIALNPRIEYLDYNWDLNGK
ncbi:MAG TPA: DUF547 domain-containing protein [Saprospiraceae bacterium]|nr:DUF547 domain-containing protein [Saprospiraceae bacterium]